MFPKAKMVSASTEKDGDTTVFEVSIEDGKAKIQVTATADGKITEVEREIDAKDLPKDVADALEGKYPKAAIKKAERINKGEGLKELSYEVLLATADKKNLEVRLDPKGKVLNVEDQDAAKKEKKDGKK
jgi:hypothetical protein